MARRLSDDAPHDDAASTATLTASSTSAADASATSAVCTPRAGSKTGPVRPEVPAIDPTADPVPDGVHGVPFGAQSR